MIDWLAFDALSTRDKLVQCPDVGLLIEILLNERVMKRADALALADLGLDEARHYALYAFDHPRK